MTTLMASVKRAIRRRFGRSARVADENTLVLPAEFDAQRQMRNGAAGGGFSLLQEIAALPLALLACAACVHQGEEHPPLGWPDNGEAVSRISEINHLMVRDSMRYAIFV
ncbi:hypothetical protein EJ110_NYTH33767 [Nymphaea thermarum]|nr:hypothetical protein EJ110_NYTH33767 [Nymphaea thermarum]